MKTTLNTADNCQDNTLTATPTGTLCFQVLSQISNAKRRLVEEFRNRLQGHESALRLALSEAEALAWQTNYPQLFFPALAMEKVQAAMSWQSRQQTIRGHL